MSSRHSTPPVQRAGHAPFLSELAVLGVFRLWVKPKGMPDSFSALLTSPRLSAFTVAGADVQTLRERLINALETHSVTWPPACPPLEPARYWGSGQAWGRVARITGLEARRWWGQQGRGPRLVLPGASGAAISAGRRASWEPGLPGADGQVQGPDPPGGKGKGQAFSGPCLLPLLTPVPRNVWGCSRISHGLTPEGPRGQWAWGGKREIENHLDV